MSNMRCFLPHLSFRFGISCQGILCIDLHRVVVFLGLGGGEIFDTFGHDDGFFDDDSRYDCSVVENLVNECGAGGEGKEWNSDR